jgi:hypothetical protein
MYGAVRVLLYAVRHANNLRPLCRTLLGVWRVSAAARRAKLVGCDLELVSINHEMCATCQVHEKTYLEYIPVHESETGHIYHDVT